MALEPLLPVLIPLALTFLATKLWTRYLNNCRDMNNSLPLPPGDFGLPLVGESLQFLFKGFDFFREKREKFGQVYKTHILGKPTIRVFGSANLRTVLRSDEVLVTTHWPLSVQRLMGMGALAQSTRRLHSLRRTSLLKAFSSQAIAGYLPSIQSSVRQHLEAWACQGSVMVGRAGRTMSLDMITQVIFGFHISSDTLTALSDALLVIQDNLFSMPYEYLPGSGIRKGLKARAVIVDTLNAAIKQAASERDKRLAALDAAKVLATNGVGEAKGNGTVEPDAEVKAPAPASSTSTHSGHYIWEEGDCVLDTIFGTADYQGLTLGEIRDNCLEMIFSAFGGISSAVCSTLSLLNDHPSCVQRIRDELASVGLLDQSADGDLTPDTLRRMPYSQNVVKETLRKVPPFGGGYREVMRTFELEGYQIPKGWTLLWSIRDQHETPSVFENPDQFDPDRWTEDRDQTRYDQYSYLPFGSGLRKCVGERYVMTVLHLVLIELVRGYDWSVQSCGRMSYFPVALPVDDLPVTFTPRSRQLSAESCSSSLERDAAAEVLAR